MKNGISSDFSKSGRFSLFDEKKFHRFNDDVYKEVQRKMIDDETGDEITITVTVENTELVDFKIEKIFNYKNGLFILFSRIDKKIVISSSPPPNDNEDEEESETNNETIRENSEFQNSLYLFYYDKETRQIAAPEGVTIEKGEQNLQKIIDVLENTSFMINLGDGIYKNSVFFRDHVFEIPIVEALSNFGNVVSPWSRTFRKLITNDKIPFIKANYSINASDDKIYDLAAWNDKNYCRVKSFDEYPEYPIVDSDTVVYSDFISPYHYRPFSQWNSLSYGRLFMNSFWRNDENDTSKYFAGSLGGYANAGVRAVYSNKCIEDYPDETFPTGYTSEVTIPITINTKGDIENKLTFTDDAEGLAAYNDEFKVSNRHLYNFEYFWDTLLNDYVYVWDEFYYNDCKYLRDTVDKTGFGVDYLGNDLHDNVYHTNPLKTFFFYEKNNFAGTGYLNNPTKLSYTFPENSIIQDYYFTNSGNKDRNMDDNYLIPEVKTSSFIGAKVNGGNERLIINQIESSTYTTQSARTYFKDIHNKIHYCPTGSSVGKFLIKQESFYPIVHGLHFPRYFDYVESDDNPDSTRYLVLLDNNFTVNNESITYYSRMNYNHYANIECNFSDDIFYCYDGFNGHYLFKYIFEEVDNFDVYHINDYHRDDVDENSVELHSVIEKVINYIYNYEDATKKLNLMRLFLKKYVSRELVTETKNEEVTKTINKIKRLGILNKSESVENDYYVTYIYTGELLDFEDIDEMSDADVVAKFEEFLDWSNFKPFFVLIKLYSTHLLRSKNYLKVPETFYDVANNQYVVVRTDYKNRSKNRFLGTSKIEGKTDKNKDSSTFVWENDPFSTGVVEEEFETDVEYNTSNVSSLPEYDNRVHEFDNFTSADNQEGIVSNYGHYGINQDSAIYETDGNGHTTVHYQVPDDTETANERTFRKRYGYDNRYFRTLNLYTNLENLSKTDISHATSNAASIDINEVTEVFDKLNDLKNVTELYNDSNSNVVMYSFLRVSDNIRITNNTNNLQTSPDYNKKIINAKNPITTFVPSSISTNFNSEIMGIIEGLSYNGAGSVFITTKDSNMMPVISARTGLRYVSYGFQNNNDGEQIKFDIDSLFTEGIIVTNNNSSTDPLEILAENNIAFLDDKMRFNSNLVWAKFDSAINTSILGEYLGEFSNNADASEALANNDKVGFYMLKDANRYQTIYFSSNGDSTFDLSTRKVSTAPILYENDFTFKEVEPYDTIKIVDNGVTTTSTDIGISFEGINEIRQKFNSQSNTNEIVSKRLYVKTEFLYFPADGYDILRGFDDTHDEEESVDAHNYNNPNPYKFIPIGKKLFGNNYDPTPFNHDMTHETYAAQLQIYKNRTKSLNFSKLFLNHDGTPFKMACELNNSGRSYTQQQKFLFEINRTNSLTNFLNDGLSVLLDKLNSTYNNSVILLDFLGSFTYMYSYDDNNVNRTFSDKMIITLREDDGNINIYMDPIINYSDTGTKLEVEYHKIDVNSLANIEIVYTDPEVPDEIQDIVPMSSDDPNYHDYSQYNSKNLNFYFNINGRVIDKIVTVNGPVTEVTSNGLDIDPVYMFAIFGDLTYYIDYRDDPADSFEVFNYSFTENEDLYFALPFTYQRAKHERNIFKMVDGLNVNVETNNVFNVDIYGRKLTSKAFPVNYTVYNESNRLNAVLDYESSYINDTHIFDDKTTTITAAFALSNQNPEDVEALYEDDDLDQYVYTFSSDWTVELVTFESFTHNDQTNENTHFDYILAPTNMKLYCSKYMDKNMDTETANKVFHTNTNPRVPINKMIGAYTFFSVLHNTLLSNNGNSYWDNIGYYDGSKVFILGVRNGEPIVDFDSSKQSDPGYNTYFKVDAYAYMTLKQYSPERYVFLTSYNESSTDEDKNGNRMISILKNNEIVRFDLDGFINKTRFSVLHYPFLDRNNKLSIYEIDEFGKDSIYTGDEYEKNIKVIPNTRGAYSIPFVVEENLQTLYLGDIYKNIYDTRFNGYFSIFLTNNEENVLVQNTYRKEIIISDRVKLMNDVIHYNATVKEDSTRYIDLANILDEHVDFAKIKYEDYDYYFILRANKYLNIVKCEAKSSNSKAILLASIDLVNKTDYVNVDGSYNKFEEEMKEFSSYYENDNERYLLTSNYEKLILINTKLKYKEFKNKPSDNYYFYYYYVIDKDVVRKIITKLQKDSSIIYSIGDIYHTVIKEVSDEWGFVERELRFDKSINKYLDGVSIYDEINDFNINLIKFYNINDKDLIPEYIDEYKGRVFVAINGRIFVSNMCDVIPDSSAIGVLKNPISDLVHFYTINGNVKDIYIEPAYIDNNNLLIVSSDRDELYIFKNFFSPEYEDIYEKKYFIGNDERVSKNSISYYYNFNNDYTIDKKTNRKLYRETNYPRVILCDGPVDSVSLCNIYLNTLNTQIDKNEYADFVKDDQGNDTDVRTNIFQTRFNNSIKYFKLSDDFSLDNMNIEVEGIDEINGVLNRTTSYIKIEQFSKQGENDPRLFEVCYSDLSENLLKNVLENTDIKYDEDNYSDYNTIFMMNFRIQLKRNIQLSNDRYYVFNSHLEYNDKKVLTRYKHINENNDVKQYSVTIDNKNIYKEYISGSITRTRYFDKQYKDLKTSTFSTSSGILLDYYETDNGIIFEDDGVFKNIYYYLPYKILEDPEVIHEEQKQYEEQEGTPGSYEDISVFNNAFNFKFLYKAIDSYFKDESYSKELKLLPRRVSVKDLVLVKNEDSANASDFYILGKIRYINTYKFTTAELQNRNYYFNFAFTENGLLSKFATNENSILMIGTKDGELINNCNEYHWFIVPFSTTVPMKKSSLVIGISNGEVTEDVPISNDCKIEFNIDFNNLPIEYGSFKTFNEFSEIKADKSKSRSIPYVNFDSYVEYVKDAIYQENLYSPSTSFVKETGNISNVYDNIFDEEPYSATEYLKEYDSSLLVEDDDRNSYIKSNFMPLKINYFDQNVPLNKNQRIINGMKDNIYGSEDPDLEGSYESGMLDLSINLSGDNDVVYAKDSMRLMSDIYINGLKLFNKFYISKDMNNNSISNYVSFNALLNYIPNTVSRPDLQKLIEEAYDFENKQKYSEGRDIINLKQILSNIEVVTNFGNISEQEKILATINIDETESNITDVVNELSAKKIYITNPIVNIQIDNDTPELNMIVKREKSADDEDQVLLLGNIVNTDEINLYIIYDDKTEINDNLINPDKRRLSARRINPRFYKVSLNEDEVIISIKGYNQYKGVNTILIVNGNLRNHNMFFNEFNNDIEYIDLDMVTANDDFQIFKYLSDDEELKSEDLEIIANGYTLYPNIDYTLASYKDITNLVMFRDIIPKDKKIDIEINLQEKNSTTTIYKTHQAYCFEQLIDSFDQADNFEWNPKKIPLSRTITLDNDAYQFIKGKFDLFINNRKIPNDKIEILNSKTIKINDGIDYRKSIIGFEQVSEDDETIKLVRSNKINLKENVNNQGLITSISIEDNYKTFDPVYQNIMVRFKENPKGMLNEETKINNKYNSKIKINNNTYYNFDSLLDEMLAHSCYVKQNSNRIYDNFDWLTGLNEPTANKLQVLTNDTGVYDCNDDSLPINIVLDGHVIPSNLDDDIIIDASERLTEIEETVSEKNVSKDYVLIHKEGEGKTATCTLLHYIGKAHPAELIIPLYVMDPFDDTDTTIYKATAISDVCFSDADWLESVIISKKIESC